MLFRNGANPGLLCFLFRSPFLLIRLRILIRRIFTDFICIQGTLKFLFFSIPLFPRFLRTLLSVFLRRFRFRIAFFFRPLRLSFLSCFLFHGYLDRYGLEGWARERYATLKVKASACVECGACETRCPYQLPIRQMLKKVAADFGE